MPLEAALKKLNAREAELARVHRIGQIGGLEVHFGDGGIRNVRSPEYLRVHGLPLDAAAESHESWVARIHPEDRQRVTRHFSDTIAGDALVYEVEYRIIRPSDGAVRWILAKAEIERDSSGKAVRLLGAHIDITARREAEEQRNLIARELVHRIANIFSVITSIVGLSARSHPGSREFAQSLISRLGALHRAHRLMVTPEAANDTLIGLARRVMEPYSEQGRERVRIEGDDVAIGRQASTGLALVFHELATNAVKYGALSAPEGLVVISTRREGDRIIFCWDESGGPFVEAEPGRQGFGSVLVDRTVRKQLDADLVFDWRKTGLKVTADIPLERLVR